MTALAVALGAAVGAPLRYLADRAVAARHDSAFPWGTLAVNVAGSFGLGALAGAAVGGAWFGMLGVGLCGALTTYSTFSFETLRLVESGARGLAAANVALSTTSSLGAAVLGLALAAGI
ncbi:MAG: fluoride efflux transporter FluC [Stackebrandtia sp.]